LPSSMSSLHLLLLFAFITIVYSQFFPSIDGFSSLTTLHKDTNFSDPKAVADKSLSTATKFIPFGNLFQLPGGGVAAGGGAAPAATTAGDLPTFPNLLG
ncbi:hypothetical protein PRIPAC_92698, partial [Pristionchus pacificus]